MPVSKNLLTRSRKYISGSLLFMFISVIFVAFGMTGNDDYNSAKREISLRRVGHELLLQSGDSTSRVLPVKRIAKNEFQISFENAFSFQPDSLVRTTRRLLSGDPLTRDHIVSVINCPDSSVAYGYAISGNEKDDIISCLGRVQPKACYFINIRFQPAKYNTGKAKYVLVSLALLTVLAFVFLIPAKRREVFTEEDQPIQPKSHATGSPDSTTALFTLGTMVFHADSRKLMINEKTIDLTKTETRVLRMFALSPNKIIERNRLQKEIWEDEGVIVGRSLDMFISKLRKKLESDPNVRIVVVRGKGYKLETS